MKSRTKLATTAVIAILLSSVPLISNASCSYCGQLNKLGWDGQLMFFVAMKGMQDWTLGKDIPNISPNLPPATQPTTSPTKQSVTAPASALKGKVATPTVEF